LGALAFGCTEVRDISVRIRPPMPPEKGAVDAGAPRGPYILDEVYRPGERCLVFGAEPLDAADSRGVRVTVVRTREIVRSGASSCLGSTGSVLLAGLQDGANYFIELVVLDPHDLDADAGAGGQLAFERRSRIVSYQNIPLRENPESPYVCLSEPAREIPATHVLLAGVEACRSAPVRPPCTLDIPYGAQCPARTE
jgi:hypothetical protein